MDGLVGRRCFLAFYSLCVLGPPLRSTPHPQNQKPKLNCSRCVRARAFLSFLSFFLTPWTIRFDLIAIMVLATGEGAGGAVVVFGAAVVAGILYGAYKVLSIGRRATGLPPGMPLICLVFCA